MSLYNMLFGMNEHSDLLLAVVGLRRVDVERFRDCFVSEDGAEILVYTRTGGGNRSDFPNVTMRKRPEWVSSTDDDFDTTYCTDRLRIPERWVGDVGKLSDVLANGLRATFARYLKKTLARKPTEADIAQRAYISEQQALKSEAHFNANGHTFVPITDHAMETALKLAEANGGKLRSFWGIAPIALRVRENFIDHGDHLTRASIDYDWGWEMDLAYWEHCKERFGVRFPLAMAKIQEALDLRRAKP